MRLMRLIGPMRLIGLIGLIGLMGCSKAEEEQLSNDTTIEVMSYVAGFEENTFATRSWVPPTPYELYGETDKAIGIAFTKDNGDVPKLGHFFASSGKWRTNIDDIEANTTYYLYGYVPHFGGISMSITTPTFISANANYSAGAIVTLNDVPAVMPSDLCVVIGAKAGTDKETVTGLRRGDFAYVASASADDNYVFLLFDHLYAALRIRMRVHDDYAALRTIKLKSLSLKTYAGETTSSQKTNIEVSLEATDGSNPIHDITYAPSGGEITEPLEFWSSEGELLTTAFKSFVGHFMPDGITTLVLTSVYDVYDTQGNLIRKDCKATNTMKLSELLTGQVTTRRGSRYTINMTIKPTYLYMLSEPDLNNPTVTVEKKGD